MSQHLQDQWARWVLERQYGGDAAHHQRVMADLYPVRDRVLQHAHLTDGEVLLDVGAGSGLIAFGALPLVGPRGTIIVSDISQDLLDYTHALAVQLGVLDRCQFVRAAADDLAAIATTSVDVVTTRSVLIYVTAKHQALAEFYRVLTPGGRLSIFEPINNYDFGPHPHEFWGYNVAPVAELVDKVQAVYGRAQPADSNPMLDFDDRSLVRFAQDAGFAEVHLELQVEVGPGAWHRSWDAFLHTAPNPLTLTLDEAMQAALAPDEAAQLTAYLRPLVEAERGIKRFAWAYLWAVKR